MFLAATLHKKGPLYEYGSVYDVYHFVLPSISFDFFVRFAGPAKMGSDSGLDMDANEKAFEESTTAVPTPLQRSTTASLHSTEGKEFLDEPKERHETQGRSRATSVGSSKDDVDQPEEETGVLLEQIESSM